MRGANFAKTIRARRLRESSTKAELRLWQRLRSRALLGHKFVRQEPIGPYIADFVCREQRLIIELDGGQHADSKRDQARDKWLADRGYRTLRFWNNEVIENIEGVWDTIANALDGQHRSRVTSHRVRGEVDFERSEKSGEGDSPSAQARGNAPSPGASRRPLPASGER
jgi:very-short-patch-repair endonuclease